MRRAQAGVLGIGLDAVEVERFRSALERRPELARRLFTAGELAACAPRRDPVPGLAARFCAKEAAMKALGVGLGAFGFHDVEVVRTASGRPELAVTGRARERAAALGARRLTVSLTHTARLASAVVLASGG
ncbi:MAG TPA: holo-ACP synthase [Acidimicrobiales bacterium]|nr:holo-ACP synthase [Acidimicrobiales bacterium]